MEISFIRRQVRCKQGVKTDRRLRNTKCAIVVALMELLCSKDISEITVTELTRKAALNRKTFYLHYNRIEDVIADFGEDLFVLAQETLLRAIDKRSGTVNVEALFAGLNRAVEENLEFFRVFVRSGAYHIFVSSAIRRKYVSGLHVFLASQINDTAHAPYVVEYLTSGVAAMYVKWLCTDLPSVSLDELSKSACALVNSTLGGTTKT